MDPLSIPVLPHLPAAETWRESTYPFASRRSPALQTLDDALETYETSFRRYSGVSQAYYLALNLGDVVVVTPLSNTTPLFAVALLFAFRQVERVTAPTAIGAVLAGAGVLLIVGG